MSGSNLPEFHFIELKGEITGGDRQPPIATEHRFLSLSRVSMNRLIATRDSANTGDPLPSISPPRVDEPATQASAQISALALDVDFSLPPGDGVIPLLEPEAQPLEATEAALSPAAEEAEPVESPSPGAEDTPAASSPETPPETPEGGAPGAIPTPSLGLETDTVLGDVQSTLDSLAEMAKDLTQQKLDALKQQEIQEKRRLQQQERERFLADKEEQLRQLEARLLREQQALQREVEEHARAQVERSAALKTLAENLEARDRNSARLAETLRQEKARNDELGDTLQRRGDALDDREASLNRKEEDLAEKLKQLVAAKDRFRSLVRSFNETVQFNNTLNAISSASLDEGQS